MNLECTAASDCIHNRGTPSDSQQSIDYNKNVIIQKYRLAICDHLKSTNANSIWKVASSPIKLTSGRNRIIFHTECRRNNGSSTDRRTKRFKDMQLSQHYHVDMRCPDTRRSTRQRRHQPHHRNERIFRTSKGMEFNRHCLGFFFIRDGGANGSVT